MSNLARQGPALSGGHPLQVSVLLRRKLHRGDVPGVGGGATHVLPVVLQVVERKSNPRTSQYRAGTSQRAGTATTFREQMADYARGERLLELRAERHMSRENVAHEIGITTKTLYEREHDGAIKWENAKRIAKFYGEKPEDLVRRESNAQVAAQQEVRAQLDRIEEKLDRVLATTESPQKRATGQARAAVQRSQRRKPGSQGSTAARKKAARK